MIITTLDNKIQSLDPTLFSVIPSQTSKQDRTSLLLLQNCVRSRDEYIYLEIGSYLGGTIQPHLVDPKCKLIYSIDKRSEFCPDECFRLFRYPNNSTERMLTTLSRKFPSILLNKIRTFDCETSNLDLNRLGEKPNFCFIDGEHKNQVTFSDFKFCLQACHPNAIIAFHDSWIIYKGINMAKKYLSSNSIQFKGFTLNSSVYVILLNEAISFYADKVESLSIDEREFFRNARIKLWKIRISNLLKKNPQIYYLYRSGKSIMKNLLNRST